MDDFTQTKLINNLIDLVAYFYENKHKKSDPSQVRYLKGFCEGIAHTLVESGVLSDDEAKKILKGLGKKRSAEAPSIRPRRETTAGMPSAKKRDPFDNLDIPTIFRKEQENQKESG